MEKFQELRQKAEKRLKTADHMLTMTYPFVQDPKLLMAVVENLFLALANAMGSVLYYERLFKRIPPFQDTFISKFNMFKEKCSPKYKIDAQYLQLIMEIRDIIVEHKKSPVEFSKKDRFIICSDDYKMKSVTVSQLKDYIKKTKLFITEVHNICSKDESIFK